MCCRNHINLRPIFYHTSTGALTHTWPKSLLLRDWECIDIPCMYMCISFPIIRIMPLRCILVDPTDSSDIRWDSVSWPVSMGRVRRAKNVDDGYYDCAEVWNVPELKSGKWGGQVIPRETILTRFGTLIRITYEQGVGSMLHLRQDAPTSVI